MASKLWFRLYTEIIDDPKLKRWTGDQFRVLIYLFCLAKESEEPSLIKMTPEEIAWRIRRPLDEVMETLALAQEGPRPIIEEQENGFRVVRFLDRQYEYDSDKPDAVKARVQKHRAKQKIGNESPGNNVTTCNELKRDRNDDVTRNSRAEQKRADTDPEQSRAECNESSAALPVLNSDKNQNPAGEVGRIFKRSLTEKEVENLESLAKRYPLEMIFEACTRAEARGRPKLHYAEGILSDWAKAGLSTLDAVMQADPSTVSNSARAGTDDPAKVVKLEQKRREETIRAACDYITLQCGPDPPRDQAEEIARGYGEEYVSAIIEKVYGSRSP